MNRTVVTLGAVIGAFVLPLVGCTPNPGPAAVDRINYWTADDAPVHTNLVIEPGGPLPSGFIENTGLPYGIPDSNVTFSLYDGAPSVM